LEIIRLIAASVPRRVGLSVVLWATPFASGPLALAQALSREDDPHGSTLKEALLFGRRMPDANDLDAPAVAPASLSEVTAKDRTTSPPASRHRKTAD
jgi:hypothetical protein